MPKKKDKEGTFSENLKLLDDLIERCYQELLKSVKENAKLGDFIKMIELRRKIAPMDNDQQQFWSMLEKIRKESLTKDSKASSKKKVSGRVKKGA